MKPSLDIISFLGNASHGPRATRTTKVAAALDKVWSSRLISPPRIESTSKSPQTTRSRLSSIRHLQRHVLLDRYELASRKTLSSWSASVPALVIGLPFSTAAIAARRLRVAGVPYVVDFGDLWIRGVPDLAVDGIAAWRSRRLEDQMFGRSQGIVVATSYQRQVLDDAFPTIPKLVRPNGFEPTAFHPPGKRIDPTELRLVHLGTIYHARVNIGPFFNQLLNSGRWSSVTLVQLGAVGTDVLANMPADLRIEALPEMPLSEAYDIAAGCHAALVVGNRHGIGVPSKAIQYLDIPLPKIAIVNSPDSELAAFAGSRSGWLATPLRSVTAASEVANHLSDRGTATRHAPEGDSWLCVANEIAAFVTRHLIK